MRRLMKSLLALLLGAVALFGLSWIIYMPNSDERGAWRAVNDGAVLHLTRLTATLYSESSHSCLSEISFPAHLKLIELAEGARVSMVGTQLDLFVDGSLETVRFDKLDGLPANCTDPTPDTATARDVFDAAWTALDEHYAFFDLHGVDWETRKALAPPPGGDTPVSAHEINAMLLDMTQGLDDGHLHFGSDQTGYDSPSLPPAWLPQDGSLTRDILRDVALSNAGVDMTRSDDAPVLYGLREDGIGYIKVLEMDVNVPFGGNSTDAMAAVFETVLRDLSDAKALVIDVRYNPGGSDTVSFGIAGHFIGTPLEAFTKTTRVGDGQTDPFIGIVAPFDSAPDLRPVVVLTSKLTGSAAEIFTLAMREIDHVTVMGEPTSGGLSDVMGFTLPNGWGLGLSNQTYLTMDGELFEKVGITPDISVPFRADEFLAGRDPVLEAAFNLALDGATE